MSAKQIAVITHGPSDLSDYLARVPGLSVRCLLPAALPDTDLAPFDAFFLLGSAGGADCLDLTPPQRCALEAQRRPGVRFFAACCRSIGTMYTAAKRPSGMRRLVCCAAAAPLGLEPGTLLDDYAGYDWPQNFLPARGRLLLARCGRPMAHSHMEPPAQADVPADLWALWLEAQDLMVSSLPLENFVRARYAPHAAWALLVQGIVRWTCDLPAASALPDFAPCYRLGGHAAGTLEDRMAAGIQKAIGWYTRSGILSGDGTHGVYEGLSAEIAPDGTQPYLAAVRTDCVGETALAYFAHGQLTGDASSRRISDRLEAYGYRYMQQQGGLLDGMVRWTQHAWGVCYGDDVARFVLCTLYKARYGGHGRYLPQAGRALDFLLRTTGSDGLRVARTDAHRLQDEADIAALAKSPSGFASAHYNAYPMAALILYGQLTGQARYTDAGEKGLSALMAAYPHTQREHSETQEQCRLVLPLALLYEARPTEQHLAWLHRVCDDLSLRRCPGGGYYEWDSDYSAAFSRKPDTECSLLAENGDPVCDLLYSLNWLPLGFLQAWLATGEARMLDLWRGICSFLLDVQLHAHDRRIDGGWPRAVDVQRREVYAMPYDAGWGPWVIESGWTVGEIAAGMALGLYEARRREEAT